jgi:glycosyltransferase involved in cell wall biosynthesis
MKRALIVTYYWPPAGGPGVQRWLNFVKYLRDFDVEPVVYVPENPHYPIIDEELVSRLPSDLTILKQPIREPYRFAGLISKRKTNLMSSGIISEKKQSLLEKWMLYVRGNFFIPDARIGWVRPSVTFLSAWLTENDVDVIITTGPPHSVHLIGLHLKKQHQIPWIADFRDPWTTIHYHKSLRLTKASEAKHKKMEATVLNTSDHIVVTSPSTKTEFKTITTKPITVITNGYETSEVKTSVLDKKFSLSHIGSMLSERNPEILWQVLSELVSEVESFADSLEIKLAGTVSEAVRKSLEANGLQAFSSMLGYVDLSEARNLQRNSQLLLVIEMNRPETRAIIPGKLFECLAAGRPVIAIGPEGSDMQAIVDATKIGNFFSYTDKDRLKQQLQRNFEAFMEGHLEISPVGIQKYSRRELTRELSKLIHSL